MGVTQNSYIPRAWEVSDLKVLEKRGGEVTPCRQLLQLTSGTCWSTPGLAICTFCARKNVMHGCGSVS